MTTGNKIYDLSSLVLIDGFHVRHPLFQELVSQVEIIFHGLGGGAERVSTIAGLFANQLRITSNLELFFNAVHDKHASIKSKSKTPCKHQMPPSCVPLYMIFRHIAITLGCGNTSSVVPDVPGRTYLMKHALCKHFGIDPKVISATDIRHLYTTINNIIHDKSQPTLIADDEGARANNHTPGVHQQWYKTSIIGAEARRFSLYHDTLGESSITSDCNYCLELEPISDWQMTTALRGMFGHQATFNSKEQQDMVRFSCNSRDKHKYYGLRCGYGKTLSLLIPIAIEKKTMRFSGCRVFVLPYSFLVDSLHQAFKNKLQHFDVNISTYTASSITEESLPIDLVQDNLPDILILTTDAAANLIQYHPVSLHRWHSKKILSGIWFDEVQTILGEFSFRPVYQQLRLYASIGVPISLLSGSYPKEMVLSLLRGFGLITPEQNESSVDFVQSPDLIGNGFDLEVIMVTPDNIINATIELIDEYCKTYNRSVQIMCSSKEECQAFGQRMKDQEDVRVVHSGTTKEEQTEAAEAWYSGKVKKLFITSMGIVGNENEDLGAVFVVRLLYNLSNFLQILGRLRPKQRGDHAKIYQIFTQSDLQGTIRSTNNADNIRADLLQAGYINNNDMSVYNKAFHIKGYQSIFRTPGCYFNKLAKIFSSEELPSCQSKCTWCRHNKLYTLYTPKTNHQIHENNNETALITPPRISVMPATNPYLKRTASQLVSNVEKSAKVARINNQHTVEYQLIAERKLSWLKSLCPGTSCPFASCNGEFCLNNACYICGVPGHQTQQCPLNSRSVAAKDLDRYLKDKGYCNWCLGKMKGSTDAHGPAVGDRTNKLRCPLQKRLRRAINMEYQKVRSKTFYSVFLRQIFATDEKYYEFIAKLDIDVSSTPRI